MSQSSELCEEDLENMEKSSVPRNTALATKYGVNKFQDWLEKRNKICDYYTISPLELNELLRKFYGEIHPKKPGMNLTPSSLSSVRIAIHRFITSAPYNRPVNIIKDIEFTSAKNIFQAKCKLYFKAGNPKPKHKPTISDQDIKKIGLYLSQYQSSPQILTEAVWFNLCYSFGRRGREGWTNMTKDTFPISVDSDGIEFVEISKTVTSKNYQGGNKKNDIDYNTQRMYGDGVAVFKFYLTKLNPNCSGLFQHPRKTYSPDEHWFKNEPIGKNILAAMMKRISAKAGLSMQYTCHSVRVATVTNLYQGGVNPETIRTITNHKNVESLKHYISDSSVGQKRACSNILNASLSINPDNELPFVNIARGNFSIAHSILDNNTDADKMPEIDDTSESLPNEQMYLTAQDGIITIPPNAPPGTVFSVDVPQPSIQPSSALTTNCNNFMNNSNSQALQMAPNIMAGSTFNNCTFNMNYSSLPTSGK